MKQPRDNSGQHSSSSGPLDPSASLHGTPAEGGYQAGGSATPPQSKHCQPDSVWLELCAGTLPEDVASLYLRHAAECPTCGPIFREAVQVFNEEATLEEETLLASLATSQPGNQRALAYRLHAAAGGASFAAAPQRLGMVAKPTWRERLFSWPSLTLAGAACALAVTAVYLHARPANDDALLASAYDHHRVSELRIPGESAGPLYSPTRGTGAGDLSSHDLRALKLRVGDQYDRNPNDPAVRQMQGRIALVDHDGEAARRQFEMAEALNPALPNLKFDLASAEFVLAETTGQGLGYARAIDLYSQYLHGVNGQDATALYDRGLCWERSAVTFEAVKDFQAALALEKDPAWRKQIQQHLDHLKATEIPASNAAPTPQSFLAVPPSGRQYDAPGRYEQYLDVASREWLPNRQDPQTAQALTGLAALGQRHQDAWLTDFLAAPPVPEADAALAKALDHSLAGRYDETLTSSEQAATLYKASGNQPGYVRAAAEHVFALQRLTRAPDSIAEANLLQARPEIHRYRWISLFLALAQSGSHLMTGDFSNPGALDEVRVAAEQAALPLIGLRALTFDASGNILRKRYAQGWTQTLAAMRLLQSLSPNPVRKFQVIRNAREIARALDLRWTDAGLTEAAAQAAAGGVNDQVIAYALEELAVSQLTLGDGATASRTFAQADHIIANQALAPMYQAVWATDRARLHARNTSMDAGLNEFAAAEPNFIAIGSAEERIGFFTQYSLLLRQAGRIPEAIAKLWPALRDVENSRSHDRRDARKVASRKDAELVYELLTLEIAEANRPELALRAWEWRNSAPARTASPLVGTGTFEDLDRSFPKLPPAVAGQATLVFARTFDHVLVWEVPPAGGGAIAMHLLQQDPDLLLREVRGYERMAADPQSSVTDLALLGEVLSHTLLQPVQPGLSGATLVRLDLDPSLAGLPFAALSVEGRPLILSHALVTLVPDWTLHDPAPQGAFLPGTSVLVVRQAVAAANGLALPDEHDESGQIVRFFPSTRIERASVNRTADSLALSGLPSLPGELRDAAIVHYAGHGLEEASPTLSTGPALALPHCRLAVLAACQSLHEREDTSRDVPSFARIVLAAGARQVLATQWDVDSEMTRRLMLTFYAQLSRGSTSAAALAQAQQALLADPATQHPYFWSAFQIVTR